MKTAIGILEHELSYALATKVECDESDDFYRGWVKSLECAIGVLRSCDIASQPNVPPDPWKHPGKFGDPGRGR